MLNQHFALVHPTLQPQDPPALAAERILSNINAESLFFIGRNATTLSTGQSKHSLVHKFIVTGHQSSIPMEYQALECSVVDPTAAPAPRQSSQDALYSAATSLAPLTSPPKPAPPPSSSTPLPHVDDATAAAYRTAHNGAIGFTTWFNSLSASAQIDEIHRWHTSRN
jgi:hypothetical protein